MIKTSRQLKDLLRNLSAKVGIDPQILMRIYMMERLLERISISEYKDKFILKGGMLVTSMAGLAARSTMDMDTTIRGIDMNMDSVFKTISSITEMPYDDGVTFKIKSISQIMEDAEYPGVRLSMEAGFDGTRTPLKIDVSTGDVITPKEIDYSFKMMLENRSINILAYNLETVLAEKLETIISRDVSNTRMRDFYDVHILLRIYENVLDPAILNAAFTATATKRNTLHRLADVDSLFDKIQSSSNLREQWVLYQKDYLYAKSITWENVMESVRMLYKLCMDKDLNLTDPQKHKKDDFKEKSTLSHSKGIKF